MLYMESEVTLALEANLGVGRCPVKRATILAPAESASMAVHHENAILALAEHSQVSRDVIETLYWKELKKLEPARITQYLPLVASRRVREALRQRERRR